MNEARRHDLLRGALAQTPAPAGLDERILRRLRERCGSGARALTLDVAASASGIRRIQPGTGVVEAPSGRARALAEQARDELAEYFQGVRSYFTVPVDLAAAGAFQRAVLETARSIPFGRVRSYRWIAETIASPRAVRAVGTALGRNPVPIIVPCHRVLRSDGGLGGYAFGLEWKEALLEIERETFAIVGSETTRIVCRSGCASERRIAERNRVAFASVTEAVASGYRPCRICLPAAANLG